MRRVGDFTPCREVTEALKALQGHDQGQQVGGRSRQPLRPSDLIRGGGERLVKLRVPTLLILDEMGYLPLDQVATSFLFQLVSKRYTRGSIIVTSNKSYSEWGAVFGDEVAVAAIIDRLLHYSTTVNIRGESYRLKDKKRAGIFTMPTTTLATTAPQVGNLRPALRRNRS